MSLRMKARKKMRLLKEKSKKKPTRKVKRGARRLSRYIHQLQKNKNKKIHPCSLAIEVAQASSATRTSSSSRYYAQFRNNSFSGGTPAPSQLSCDDHPFFEDLHPLPDNLRSEVLAIEGDIFKGCVVSWNPYKTCIESEPFEAALKLEGYFILDILLRTSPRWLQ